MFLVAPSLLAWCWPSTHKHPAPRQKRRLRRPRLVADGNSPGHEPPGFRFSRAFVFTFPRPINLPTRLKQRLIANLNTRDSRSPSMGTDGEEPDSHRHHGRCDIPGNPRSNRHYQRPGRVWILQLTRCRRSRSAHGAFAASHRADDGGEGSAGPAGVTLRRRIVRPWYICAAASCSSASAWV